MKVLVTGAAGFIGAHVCRALVARGDDVYGVDNFNAYYDPQLKLDRVIALCPQVRMSRIDICDRDRLAEVFDSFKPDRVVHLAAQAGVRYSIENPVAYIESNLLGFGNVIEACRQAKLEHFVYASSSSVYGGNEKLPFSESDNVDRPLSLYAATKKANELIAHSYSHLYGLPTTGLRFFTVYGPWGRPDMALFKFTKAILTGERIDVFNHGNHRRDFTYIDDIVEGVIRVLDGPQGCKIYNIGNGSPINLTDFIDAVFRALGRTAAINILPMQPGDVEATHADVSRLRDEIGYAPSTSVQDGIARFVDWYLDRYAMRAAA
jgi:UDP-glucuronate 4-epimerase